MGPYCKDTKDSIFVYKAFIDDLESTEKNIYDGHKSLNEVQFSIDYILFFVFLFFFIYKKI